MTRIIVLTILLFLVIGCKHLDTKYYIKKDLIGISDQKTGLILAGDKVVSRDIASLKSVIEKDSEASRVVNSHCSSLGHKGVIVAVPIIAATGKLLFDIYMHERALKLERLKKKAQGTYSGVAILSARKFKNCDCAILTRYSDDDKNNPGLIAIVKLQKYGLYGKEDAFAIKPIYVRAFNSVALTSGRELKEEETDEIGEDEKMFYPMNVSIGIALKAIGKNDSDLPSVFSIGEGSVSIPNLKIGPSEEPYKCISGCPSSDIIPYALENDSTISVAMSVIETGDVGIDFDQKEAELKAIKEAIGPALSEAIKISFEKDDE